jgi:c-di-GMP-binding flagellar brake protein YcgR
MLKKLFGKENRAQYRVTQEQLEADQEISIRFTADDETFEGLAQDICIGGTAVTLPELTFASLSEGDIIPLHITVKGQENDVVITGIIRNISIKDNDKTIHFQFIDSEGLPVKLNTSSFSAFNRRQCYRVAPIEVEHLPVTIRWSDEVVEGWLIDLSLTGMGLGVTPEIARHLGQPERIRLRFVFPEKEEELQISGKIQFHRQAGDHYLYGVKFIYSDFAEGHRQEKAISAFLMKQQQLFLQKRAHVKYDG